MMEMDNWLRARNGGNLTAQLGGNAAAKDVINQLAYAQISQAQAHPELLPRIDVPWLERTTGLSARRRIPKALKLLEEKGLLAIERPNRRQPRVFSVNFELLTHLYAGGSLDDETGRNLSQDTCVLTGASSQDTCVLTESGQHGVLTGAEVVVISRDSKESLLKKEPKSSSAFDPFSPRVEDEQLLFDGWLPETNDRKEQVYFAIASWNALAADIGVPRVIKATRKRVTAIHRRYAELVEYMPTLFTAIRASDFLSGRSNGFRITFDFLWDQPDRYVQILEGKFATTTASKAGTDKHAAAQRRLSNLFGSNPAT